ncbi:MAG: PRC-barrel domain containing protein [Betaproteobacteria bacterium]|nr:MAG: PRC-barrel domain containing protein [Betaproteobacteria bacterium]
MNLNIAKSLAIAAFSSIALLTVAMAAQDAATSTTPIAGKATLGVSVAETAVIATGWRASKLLHAAVYNENNEKIGSIDDFIVAPDGSLSVAVIDVGGFLRIGSHRVAIPVQQFDQVAPKIVLKGATKDALLKMPEFKYAA